MPSSPIERVDICKEKERLRTHFRLLRKQIPVAERTCLDAAIVSWLTEHPLYRDCKTLLCFYPIGSEPNLLTIAEHALACGKSVAFPRCDTQSTFMTFHTVTEIAALFRGAYGIYEPSVDAPIAPNKRDTLCLVPALAFDQNGYRIGYGKGYYDRFLADFAGSSLGITYAVCLCDSLPIYPTDRAVDLILTEKGEIDPNETKKR